MNQQIGSGFIISCNYVGKSQYICSRTTIYALERLLADSQTLVHDNSMKAVDTPNIIKPRKISLCNYP